MSRLPAGQGPHLREDNWHRQVVSEGTVALQCLDIAVPLAVIYEDVPPL